MKTTEDKVKQIVGKTIKSFTIEDSYRDDEAITICFEDGTSLIISGRSDCGEPCLWISISDED